MVEGNSEQRRGERRGKSGRRREREAQDRVSQNGSFSVEDGISNSRLLALFVPSGTSHPNASPMKSSLFISLLSSNVDTKLKGMGHLSPFSLHTFSKLVLIAQGTI